MGYDYYVERKFQGRRSSDNFSGRLLSLEDIILNKKINRKGGNKHDLAIRTNDSCDDKRNERDP